MRILRHLQHWLTGQGLHIAVADFVPETHPIRQWADTFPWAALVAAVDRSFARRFPTPTARGRTAVATRVGPDIEQFLLSAQLKIAQPLAMGASVVTIKLLPMDS